MATSGGQTIAEAAQACLSSFNKCLQTLLTLGPRERALVQNQQSRFSLWTANIGVFAPGRASMDYRLRHVEDVHRLVRGLLEALDASLAKCLSTVTAWASLPQAQPDEKDTQDAQDLATRLEAALQSVSGDIHLLHQLANTISKAGRASQNSKAATMFEIKDDEGRNIESALTLIFLKNMSDQFPCAEEDLLRRLASTMVLRRKRMLYRRSRRAKYLTPAPAAPPEPAEPAPSPSPRQVMVMQPPTTAGAHHEAPKHCSTLLPSSEHSLVESQAMTTTTLDPQRLQNPSTPSVVSGARSVALNKHDHLVFPRPPRASILDRFRWLRARRRAMFQDQLERLPNYSAYSPEGDHAALSPAELVVLRAQMEALRRQLHSDIEMDRRACSTAEMEVFCPYCLEALSSTKMRDEENWREHLKNDLDPYVCLFVDCASPEELYSRSETWLAHMRQHALRWNCHAKSHEPLIFHRKEDYESHMRETHRAAFTDAQLSVVAERNARVMGPLFESCPLCGITEEDDTLVGSLEDHMVGHMRFLALKSLPFIEEEEYNSNSSNSVRSDSNAKPVDRSTLRDLLDQGDVLDFDHYASVREEPLGNSEAAVADQTFPQEGDDVRDVGVGLDHRRIFDGPEGDEAMPVSLQESHGDTYGNPTSLLETQNWDNLSSWAIRGAQWGFVIDAISPCEADEGDPILETFLAHATKTPPATELDHISRLLQSAAVPSLPDGGLFVPKDVIDSVLTYDKIAALLREAKLPESQIPSCGKFIHESAASLFSGLVWLSRPLDIMKYQEADITDVDLDNGEEVEEALRPPIPALRFHAPVFSDSRYEHWLEPRCPLPFIAWNDNPRRGPFSRIHEAEVHPSHMLVTPRVPGNPCKVVVKVIDTTTDKGTFFAESEVAYTMRKVENEHLIKPIAAYIKGDFHAIVYPRARGNLEDFWKRHDHEHHDSEVWVRWFFTQSLAICGALGSLHGPGTYAIAHENLNPRNILWFDGSREVQLRDSHNLGILVIGDSGFGNRFNSPAAGSDIRYFAPETSSRHVQSPSPLARVTVRGDPDQLPLWDPASEILQDTWSLGCILLELIIWLLLGWGEVQEFRRKTPEMYQKDSLSLHQDVVEWIERLCRDPRCAKETLLGNFMGVLQGRMLVPAGGGRAAPKLVESWLILACRLAREGQGFTAQYEDITGSLTEMVKTRRSRVVEEGAGYTRTDQQFGNWDDDDFEYSDDDVKDSDDDFRASNVGFKASDDVPSPDMGRSMDESELAADREDVLWRALSQRL